ncbi:MAG TPA: choice-of-anchor Q domain-containing protein [Bryobacteraceae bacterium]|jgi:uncharacterized repeat protein (TIGR01451 family)
MPGVGRVCAAPLGVLLIFASCTAGSAATWTVVNTNDSGVGSLRNAIAGAAAGDTINFDLTYPATITLTSGGLTINQNLAVNGPGASNLSLNGNLSNTVLTISAAAQVNVTGVTITGGALTSPFGGMGGGIANSGTLTLINTVVSGNTASVLRDGNGGGISNSGMLTIINSAITGNTASSTDFGGEGGGIYNTSTLVVVNSSFTGNAAASNNATGGAIYSTGTVVLTNSVVSANSSAGRAAGIYSTGSLTISNTRISANVAGANGGGIYTSGTASVANTTLSENTCFGPGTAVGGGVYNSGTLTLSNSTLAGNSCTSLSAVTGAGLYNVGTVWLTNDTLSGNTGNSSNGPGTGNGLSNDTGGVMTIKSTILANGTANCFATAGSSVFSAGFNLADDTTCAALLTNAGDLNNVPAGLDPAGLKDNGGPTQTIAIVAGSPAIDAVPVVPGGSCTAADGGTPVTTDQRSVSRPQGAACDMGAFESTSSAAILTLTKYHTTGLFLGQQGATYAIAVQNAGTAPGATNGMVTVMDTLPAGLTLVSMAGTGWSCTSAACTRSEALAPGASYPPITVTVNVAATAISPVSNTVTVSGGGSATATASESALIAGAPILSISATHSGSLPLGQQMATLHLVVSNAAGAGPTSGPITVTDVIPNGLSLLSLAGSGWSCNGSTCSRSDVLAAGATYPPITATVNVGAHAISPQINTATVAGGGWAGSTASDSIVISGVPILGITKTHSGNFTPGQQGAAFTIIVSNAAPAGPTSGVVSVSEAPPSGLSLVSMSGAGWSCSAVSCSRNDALAAGASYPGITVTVNVAANAATPQINTATVSGGGSASASAADVTTVTGAPVLHITKTHAGSFTVGQQDAVYNVVVSNSSGAGATSGTVSVTDTLPTGLSLVSMGGTGWSCSGPTCTRNDALAPGVSYPGITVAVNVAGNATSPQINHAAVAGGGSSPANAVDNTDILFPALSLSKSHIGNFAQGQQGAAYTLVVSNGSQGSPTSGTITVTDTLPNGLSLAAMTGSGWNCVAATCTRSDVLVAGASFPPITVAVNVASNAPSQVTNVANVVVGGVSLVIAADATTITPPSFPITGSVTAGGMAVSGVTVSLSGSASSSTVTDASGNYTFSGLASGGVYTVSASLIGYSFSGPISFSNLTASQTVNFTGIPVAGLQFYPVAPCRLADTRVNSFQTAFGPPSLSAGQTRTFNIPSNTACGIPPSAAAYSLNVTVVTKGYLGILTIWPAGQPMPNASTLNSYSSVSTAVANAAIVPAGTSGGINVWVTDPTDLVLDINGYFAPPGTGGLVFYPVTPCRLVDTRVSSFPPGFGPPTMAAGTTRTFAVPADAACSIPATAQAYSLNVTAIPQTTLGLLSVWPTGRPLPNVSTLNVYAAGTVVANAAIVPAGTNGSINTYVSDTTDLAIDIDGYFAPPSTGGLNFYPATPCRVADTRVTSFPPGLGAPPMGAGTSRSFPVTASACEIPSGAGAYSFNFTAVPRVPQLGIFITWPTGAGQPNVSTMNSYNGSVVSNAAIVPAGSGGGISIYVTDTTDVLFDVNGYFAP